MSDLRLGVPARAPGPGPPPASEVFRTADPAVAEREAAKLMSPHRLRLDGSPADFDARASQAVIADLSLMGISYGTPVTVERPTNARYVVVIMPLAGTLRVRHHESDFTAARGSAAVLSPGTGMSLTMSRHCRLLCLRAEAAAFERTLREIAPELDLAEALRFAPQVPAGAPAFDALFGVVRTLQVASRHAAHAPMRAALVDRLRDQALATILLAHDHTHRDGLIGAPPPIPARAVREALELVANEDAEQAATVAEIARTVGVSVRALEVGFRRELGCSPRHHVRRTRLARAHAELAAARPGSGVTVTEVAHRWGFAHAGRFATYYRAEYGVTPSTTLSR